MWGLYGTDVEISVVVNIGPGIPSAFDFKNIARRFSWGRKVATTVPALTNEMEPSDAKEVMVGSKKGWARDHEPRDEILHNEAQTSHRVKFNQEIPTPAGDTERKTPLAHRTTFGSEKSVGIEEKLKRDENKIEDDIRKKLRHGYEKDTPPYYRLAPERSAPGTAQNDTFSPKATLDAAKRYCSLPWVETDMEEVGHKIRSESPVLAAQ